MKNLRNRVMSILIIAIVLVVMIPLGVFAQENAINSTSYDTIPEGTYLIKNVTLDRYIQPDNDNLNVNLSELELWNTSDKTYKKWVITDLGNGYFSIINCVNSMAISVKIGEENQDSSRIIQRTYTGAYTQQWKITLTNRGYYKIAPRSGEIYTTDWCMSADDGIFFNNGWHIEQKEYTDNNYLRDEWIFECDYTLDFEGSGNAILDMSLNTNLADITSSLNSNGKIGAGTRHMTTDIVLDRMSNSRVFACITHGSQNSINTFDGYLTSSQINSLSNTAFSNLNFVYYGACLTGSGTSNLVITTYNKGADNVLGFKDSVNVMETNYWSRHFLLNLGSGNSIGTAMVYADYKVSQMPNFVNEGITTCSENRYFVGTSSSAPFN